MIAYRFEWKFWAMRSTAFYRQRKNRGWVGEDGNCTKPGTDGVRWVLNPQGWCTWNRVFGLPFHCIGQSASQSVCESVCLWKDNKGADYSKVPYLSTKWPFQPHTLCLAAASSTCRRGEALNLSAVRHRQPSPNSMIFSLHRMQGRSNLHSRWLVRWNA